MFHPILLVSLTLMLTNFWSACLGVKGLVSMPSLPLAVKH